MFLTTGHLSHRLNGLYGEGNPQRYLHFGAGILKCKEIISVNDLRSETGGLDLNSTAIQQFLTALLLWFHRSTHQGVIDKHPVWLQHAGTRALIDRERFTPSRFL